MNQKSPIAVAITVVVVIAGFWVMQNAIAWSDRGCDPVASVLNGVVRGKPETFQYCDTDRLENDYQSPVTTTMSTSTTIDTTSDNDIDAYLQCIEDYPVSQHDVCSRLYL